MLAVLALWVLTLDQGQTVLPAWKIPNSHPEYAPLDQALDAGDFRKAGRLLDGGLDVNKIVSHGTTRLTEACILGRPDIAAFLIRRGARLDQADWIGMVPLGYAANNNRPAMVDLLLKAGAKVDGAKGGAPPLQAAAGYGHIGIIRRLLRAGARIDAVDDRKMTALMAAAWEGSTEAVQVLLSAGADRKLRNRWGETALDCARQKGHREIEQILLK